MRFILRELLRIAAIAIMASASTVMSAMVSSNESGQNPIDALTRQHDLVFAGYMILLLLGAGFTYWVWTSGNRVQTAVQDEAKVRIARVESAATERIAASKRESDEKIAEVQRGAKEADARIAEAQRGSAEANERALKAQESLASAEQHAKEADAKAEGFRLDIAKANESAEQARAQVAGATAEAARANLEVARLKQPRSLTDVASLVSSLGPFKGTKYTFTGVGPDEDSIMLLRNINDVLQKAEWERSPSPGGFPGINVYGSDPNNFAVPSAILDGLRIEVEVPDAPLDPKTPLADLPVIAQRAVSLNFALFSNMKPSESPTFPRVVNVVKGNSEAIKISVGRKVVAP